MSVSAFPYGTVAKPPSGPTVAPASSGVSYSGVGATIYARVMFGADGVQYRNASATSTSMTTSVTTWLTSGLSSQVWVQRTVNSGSLNLDPGSGRLQLNSDRTFGVQDVTIAGGSVSANLTFRFYDAASGGSEIGSCTLTLTANRENPA